MLKNLFLLFYRFLYKLIQISLVLSRPSLSHKTRKWMDLRSDENYLNSTIKKPIWFHASSGEIEYCKSIIHELKKNHPACQIIVSYSSPSAEKLFENIKADVDLFFPLPWDTSISIKKCLTHFSPEILIFSRTDFWPELIEQCGQNQIPLMALSVFPTFGFLNNFIYKSFFNSFKLITTVDEPTAFKLRKLTSTSIIHHSDSRFDQVFSRLNSPSKIQFKGQKPKIVFASTWAEDETIILPFIKKELQSHQKMILCPHDVTRAANLLNVFKNDLHLNNANPLSIKLLSEYKNTNYSIQDDYNLLIIDQVGFLADIYRSTTFAFIGGSFKKKIHSVMEPLCAGNIVFFGPYHQNNPEALETIQNELTFEIKSTSDLENKMNLFNSEKIEILKLKIKDWAETKKGSSQFIVNHILNIIRTPL